MTDRRRHLPHRHLLVAALFVAPLALGSFHPLAVAVLGGLLGLSAALFAIGGSDRRLKLGLPVLLAAGLLAYTALQLVPLPGTVTEALWPAGHRVWQGALELADRPGAARPLTLEPAATLLEAAKAALVLGVFVLSSFWVREAGHRPLLTTVALVGLATALVSLVHRLAGLERVYDLYEPSQVHAVPVPAPLLNVNHLAGLLALAAPVAVGIGLEQADRARRALWLVAAGAIGMACVLTLSRGGIAALAAGAGLFAILVMRAKVEARGRRPWLVLGAAATLGGGFYVAHEAVIAEYAHGDTSKTEIWAAAWPLVRDMLPFGAGRGAFGAVFPAYSELGASVTFTHAESLAVQLAADQGFVGAAVFAALAAGVLALVLRGTHRAALAGGIAGSAALLGQNLVDFSVELPGVALPFVAVLAAALAGRRAGHGRSRGVRLPARPALAGLAALLALSATGAVWAGGRSLEADEATLRERAGAEAVTFDLEGARAAVARHPADFMVPYLAGVSALRSGEESPLPWLGWSLERNPSWGVAHLWAARAFLSSGRSSQAMVEYREAVARDRRLLGAVARDAAGRWGRFDELRPLVDVQPPSLELWGAVAAELERAGRAGEAEQADNELLAHSPRQPAALERRARAALRAGEAERASRFAARLPDGAPGTAVLRAEVLAAGGDRQAAVRELERAAGAAPDNAIVLSALAAQREAAGDLEGAREVLGRLEAATPRARIGGALMARAAFEERAGRLAEALHYYQRAATLGGGRPAHLGVARVAERRGELVRALEALRRAGSAGATDETIESRAREIESRLERSRLEGLVGGG